VEIVDLKLLGGRVVSISSFRVAYYGVYIHLIRYRDGEIKDYHWCHVAMTEHVHTQQPYFGHIIISMIPAYIIISK
jgi:hypothetical protein